MNFGAIIPPPNFGVNRPIKISPKGNLYKIPVNHFNSEGKTTSTYEIWATKEAVQKHFYGMTENPREYQLKKFAREMYEKQLRSSAKGLMEHKGMLVTTDSVTHGNPKLWPNNISHPEVKI
jgi:hypothetical protein